MTNIKNNKIVWLIIGALVLFVVWFFLLEKKVSIFVQKSPQKHTSTLMINDNNIDVKIADTSELRTKGLSGRLSMGNREGVLFVFDTKDFYKFWMYGMRFPLDFVWIDDNTVVDILEHIPPPQNVTDTNLPTFAGSKPYNKVLEVNSGIVKELKIKPGDTIILR